MIAVTFAVRPESAAFLNQLYGLKAVAPGSFPVFSGRLGAEDVLVCHTGMGASSVRASLPEAIGPHRLRGLVATGFAGALDPSLAVGDIVADRHLSAPLLLETAVALGARPLSFASRDEVAGTAREKQSLARETGAQVIDMESAAIAEICRERHIPFLAVRAISDTARRDFPVPPRILFDFSRQRSRPLALATYLATHPARVPAFAHFVSDLVQARQRLTDFLAPLLA